MMRSSCATSILLLGFISACGEPTQTVPSGRNVSRAEFEAAGLNWPLAIDSGTIGCDLEARWFEADGVRYGLNGTASEARGYQALEPIWLVDEKMMADLKAVGITDGQIVRVNVGDIISEAGKLC